MKYIAVICEYNPFHTGHAYQLDKAVRATAADGVIAVMSGNFVQRAEPAVADSFLRAECALHGGADMVVEMPVATAVAAGRDFARGGVEIVVRLPDVQYLVMGCEDEEHIATLADIQSEESAAFRETLKKLLDGGASYPTAYTAATATEAEKRGIPRSMCDEVLKKPNNLLCIEYIKALKSLHSNIQPLLIKRKGSGYNDRTPGKDYASATAIRDLLATDPYAAAAYLPGGCADKLLERVRDFPVRQDLYEALAIDALRRADKAALSALRSVSEGIENKLKDAAQNAVTLSALCEDVKTKRYTMSRVRRIVLENLLGITGNDDGTPCRILGIREDFKPYLSRLDPSFYISPTGIDGLEREQRAYELYSLLTRRPGNAFYSTRLVTV